MNSDGPYYRPENVIAGQSGGLEVVDDGRDLPQVVDGYPMKSMDSGYGMAAPAAATAAPREKKIFGLPRATLIMAVILILVIIAAAVGGAVAGSNAVSNAYE